MTWHRGREWVGHFKDTRQFDGFGMPVVQGIPAWARRMLVSLLVLCVVLPCLHLAACGVILSRIGTDVREVRRPDGSVAYWSYTWDGPKSGSPSSGSGLPRGRLERVETSPGRTVAHYVDPTGTWTGVEVPVSRIARRDGMLAWIMADMASLACALVMAFVIALLAPSKPPRGTQP